MDGPLITDWIEAVGSAFAAIGTVGAVIVALRRSKQSENRSLDVQCRLALTGGPRLISLRGTNDGFRPLKVSSAYLVSNDGRQLFARHHPSSDPLPKLVVDGESVQVFWLEEVLEEVRREEGFESYLYAFFSDTADNAYVAPYPGVKRRRKGLPWNRRDDWQLPKRSGADARSPGNPPDVDPEPALRVEGIER